MISNAAPTTSYASAAREKFQVLTRMYDSDVPSFWQLGNSFDTMIDFLDTIDSSSANDIAQLAVKKFHDKANPIDSFWFDDFGWWSIAAERALQKPFFQPNAKHFCYILNKCWSRFTDRAPFVWERHKSNTFDDYGPSVEGGVWNAYWQGTLPEYPGPNSGDPSNGGLAGIQNTVTNALYLMAAQRLGQTDPNARQAAQKELKFLLTWFDDKQDPLWWSIDENTALVRERVGHFANGKAASAPGFQADWAWAGDQGLILGCISDAMLDKEPGFREPLLSRAQQLLSGVRQKLTYKTDPSIVQSYTATGAVPGDPPDYQDYETGAGVFWRNVLYLWKTNTDLRSVLAKSEYQGMVKASADAAAQAETNGQEIGTLTNQLAVLVAAAAMLE